MPWVPTISPSDIGEDNIGSAQAGKIWVVLYRCEDDIYATAVLCTHGQASLADGFLDEYLIECPLHQGTFDVRSGDPVDPPCTVPVRTFPVKIENDVIMVEVNDDEV